MAEDPGTRKIFRNNPGAGAGDAPPNSTVRLDGSQPQRGPSGTVKTRMLSDAPPGLTRRLEEKPERAGTGEPKTRVFRPSAGLDVEFTDDPVVGWLVVVSGPGRGKALALTYGMNSIGRSSDERVRLDFGDEQISRKGHAMVTYDPRGRRFFVQHGGGANLTYLEEQPLLVPSPLSGGEMISLGETTVRFVPFCGPDFDWQDQ